MASAFEIGGGSADEVGPGPPLESVAGVAAQAFAEELGGWDSRGARTPARVRERLIEMFRAPRNIEYLRGVLAKAVPPGALRSFALDTLEDSVYSFEKIEDLIYSDPIAQRGDLRPAANLWGELSRINRAFYEYRMQFLSDKASLVTGRTGDGQWDDDEDYLTRMLTADSIRPPGLESLNANGPLFGILEDQTAVARPQWPPGARYARAPGVAPRPSGAAPPPRFAFRETFAAGPRAAAPRGDAPRFLTSAQQLRQGLAQSRTSTRSSDLAAVDPAVDPDDAGWDPGNPNRTPEQAVAEYWGEDHVESSALGAAEIGGETNGERYAQGPLWRENGGTRFMRYEGIPFWQNLSRGREYDRDIEETLGTGSREQGAHVRRWDTERMRNPRGEEYRRYGARNGSTV